MTRILTWENGQRVIRDATPDEIASAMAAALTAERACMTASRFQVRAALMQAGLLDSVTAIIAQADPLTQLAWAEAVEYRRASPALNAMAAALGLDDAAIDDLFRAAMGIAA